MLLPLEKYLGIEIVQIGDYICLSQKKYISDMTLFDEERLKKATIPMNHTVNLRKEEKNPLNESLLPVTEKSDI